MVYHMEYGIRLHTEPKHKGLYSWAINEVNADGSFSGQDQIPWFWKLHFSAVSCVLTDRLEIAEQISPKNETASQTRVETGRTIRIGLQPDARRDHGVTFSMFGTKRLVENFTLDIQSTKNADEAERCSAWGSISYTTEIDFRKEMIEDCICFCLYVKPERLDYYVAMVQRGMFNDIGFTIGGVDGFYSEWSPSISTDRVKVLLDGDEHKFDLPSAFQGNPPRLGRVRDARLLLNRHLELSPVRT